MYESVRTTAGAPQGLGVADGDRIAILSPNHIALFNLLVAVPWSGGILVPLNLRLAPAEMAEMVQDTGANLLLVGDQLMELAQQICETTSVKAVSLSELSELSANCEPIEEQGRSGEDIAVLCYTGGTTGRAKGVMLSHRSIVTGSLQWELKYGAWQVRSYAIGRTDVSPSRAAQRLRCVADKKHDSVNGRL